MKQHPNLVSSSLALMFLSSFLLTVFFSEILVQIGIPLNYVCLLFLAFAFASYLFAGMLGATMQESVYDLGDRATEPASMGQTLASAVVSASIFVLMAGQFQVNGLDALALYAGWTIGLALMVVLFSSPLARSRQKSLSAAICDGSESKLLRGAVALPILISSALILVANLEIVEFLISSFVRLPGGISVILLSLPVMFCLLAGGMHSLSIIRRLAYPVIAITFLAPVVWISIKHTGIPIPQLSYGTGSLVPVSEIDREMIEVGFASATDTLPIARQGRTLDTFNFLALLASFAAGAAVMPHVIQHFRSAPSGPDARRSGIWSFGLVFVVLTAVPAIAAFSKLEIYSSILGISLLDVADEAPWVFELSGAGDVPLLEICGKLVANSADVLAACGNDPQRLLSPGDISIDYRFVVLGSALLSDLPVVVTAILVGGAILAIMTSIDGLVLVMARTFGQDIYGHFLNPSATGGKELFITRISVVVFLAVGAYMAINHDFDILAILLAGFSVAAGGLFPVFLARVLIPGTSSLQSASVGFAGLVATLLFLFFTSIGQDLILNSGDELAFQIPAITERMLPSGAGLAGMLVSFLVMALFTISKIVILKRQKS